MYTFVYDIPFQFISVNNNGEICIKMLQYVLHTLRVIGTRGICNEIQDAMTEHWEGVDKQSIHQSLLTLKLRQEETGLNDILHVIFTNMGLQQFIFL